MLSHSMRQMFLGNTADVTIVLRTFNGEEHLEELLRRLKEQEAPFGVEILAFDGGSTDRTPLILRSAGVRTQQIECGRPYWKQAMKIAEGGVLVFVGQETLPLDKGWLFALATPLVDEDDLAIACGRLIADASVAPYLRGLISARPFLSGKEKLVFQGPEAPPGARLVPGTNCAVSRRVWRKCGELDETEGTFPQRALAAGFKRLYLPAAAAIVRSGERVGECIAAVERSDQAPEGSLVRALGTRMCRLGEELAALKERGDLPGGERGEAYAVSIALHGARMIELLHSGSAAARRVAELASGVTRRLPKWLRGAENLPQPRG